MIRVDLHLHTTSSPDSTISPRTLVEGLVANPFVKAVAVTDHGTMDAVKVVQKLASSYSDILIIPGVEITVSEGDILLLGTEELPPKPWTAETIIDYTHLQNGIAIAAHPYRAYGLGDNAIRFPLNAIEVLNGGTSLSLNRQAERLAKQMNLPGVAGTDAHSVNDLWKVFTEIEAESNVNSVLKAIKRGSIRVCRG